MYAALQGAYSDLRLASDPTADVIVSGGCAVLKSFPAGSAYDTPAKRHFEAIYWDGGYAEENGYRMGTYFQLIYLLAKYPQAYAGGQLTTGWPIVTLLYQAARQLQKWGSSGSDAVWAAYRGRLGLNLFPRVGGAAGVPYGSSTTVASMVGNDFMVSRDIWAGGSTCLHFERSKTTKELPLITPNRCTNFNTHRIPGDPGVLHHGPRLAALL